jgi:hypothetical protein
MPTRPLIFVLVFSITLFVVACSSGFTVEEVDATADAAYRAGQEAASEAAPRKAFLEVSNVRVIDNPASTLVCEDWNAGFPCAWILWINSIGEKQSAYYPVDSACHKEAKLGYDLPDDCR